MAAESNESRKPYAAPLPILTVPPAAKPPPPLNQDTPRRISPPPEFMALPCASRPDLRARTPSVHHHAALLRPRAQAFEIFRADYRKRPRLHEFALDVLLRKHHLDPHRCAFVDDIPENLRAAHRLGMSTVWVTPKPRRVPYIDLSVRSVTELPGRVFRRA